MKLRKSTVPAPALTRHLCEMGLIIRRSRLTLGALGWGGTLLAIWLGLFWLDNLLHLPAGMRLPLAAVAGGWTLWDAWRRVLKPLLHRIPAERAARELEHRCGMRDNLLINACQLESMALSGMSARLASGTVQAGVRRATDVSRDVLWEGRRMLPLAILASCMGIGWVLYMAISPGMALNALQRFSRPVSDVPPVGRFHIQVHPARAVRLYEGDDLDVSVSLTSRAGARLPEASDPADAPIIRRMSGAAGWQARLDHAMNPVGAESGAYIHAFHNVRESFTFRVMAGGSWTPTIPVEVLARPRIQESSFDLTPPAYTAQPREMHSGPPAALSVLPGTQVAVAITFDREVDAVELALSGGTTPLVVSQGVWRAAVTIADGGDYVVQVRDRGDERLLPVAAAALFLETDQTPSVRFDTEERNRFVFPGQTLELPIVSADDFGVREVRVSARRAGGRHDPFTLKQWHYQGPPGPRDDVRETLTFTVDPSRFEPGESYLLEAACADFREQGPVGRSRPIVLRVRSIDDAAGMAGEGSAALESLRKAITYQRKTLGMTRNLQLHLDEAVAARNLPAHRTGIADTQSITRKHGQDAARAFALESQVSAARRLTTLTAQEMPWALRDIQRIEGDDPAALETTVLAVAKRQAYILDELISLLGRMAAQRRAEDQLQAGSGETPPPAVTAEDAARDLRDLLKDFVRHQQRILEQSRTLMEQGPEDLTAEEEEILGKLAREEATWAEYFKDKLDDFSKLPLQDFADGALAEEFNEVFQEIQKAAESLYAKKVELAVPQEQAGLESAGELIHNLERWLPDTPDHQKWLMEEPPEMPDAPMAELPAELEDIVGELLDAEEAMTEEVEDVTSSWIDSLDKGAGWGAADGPISDMSAKGVTGNLLPNQMEIGGRSGEGRSGRSHGQMVEATAEGKGGRPTPTRLTPSPFEQGSVEDASTEDPGGATGGGKLSGFAGEGLRGPAPPPRLDQMQRLAGQQTEIRQSAEQLSLQLKRYRLPTGDIDTAIGAMKAFEQQAQQARGGELRQSFDTAVGALRDARATVARETGLNRERAAMPHEEAAALWQGLRDGIPKGYEEMVSAYFRRLAEARVEAQEEEE